MEKRNTKERVENNNSFWDVDDVLIYEEMKELGVEVLSGGLGSPPKKKTRKLNLISEELSYNDYNEETEEFEESQRSSLIKQNNFLYRQKSRSMNICQDVFASLSDEMILGIYKNLTHEDLIMVAQVCHRFKRLAYDESLWSRIDLTAKTINSNTLAYVMKRGAKILRLKETKVNSPIWNKYLNSRLSNYTSKIEYLDLSYCLISTEDLTAFLSKCRSLKKLSLESCEVSSDVCTEIAKNERLDTLNLAIVEGLTRESLELICSSCQRLQSINLAWTKLDKEAVDAFVNNVTICLLYVNLSGLQYAVNDSSVKTLVKQCSCLLELDISDCLEVTSATINAIALGLPELKSLAISRCYKIDSKEVLNALEKLPNLRSLTAFRQIRSQDARQLEATYNLLRVNKEYFSTVARPTVGIRRSSIWLARCRE